MWATAAASSGAAVLTSCSTTTGSCVEIFKKMDFDATVNIETLGNVGKAEVNPLYLQLSVGYQF
jgi:outer membrane protein W